MSRLHPPFAVTLDRLRDRYPDREWTEMRTLSMVTYIGKRDGAHHVALIENADGDYEPHVWDRTVRDWVVAPWEALS